MPASPFDPKKLLADIAALYRADETECLERMFASAQLPPILRPKATARAVKWIEDIRRHHKPQASATDLLARFGLTSQEGLALMCLAEALLRIPDPATADALIRDKLGTKHWNEALGEDSSWAINATGWALAVAGKFIHLDEESTGSAGAALGRLVSRLGQPIIREAIRTAMEWLADQFVMGGAIGTALERSKRQAELGVRFSFDMLGEGARTAADAERYWQAYADAIEAVGNFQEKGSYARAPGISVKLSALHPRYEMAQRPRALRELVPRLVALCEHAARHNIPLTIDAEEVDRLQLSLEIGAALLDEAKLGDWEGLGFAVQAYQKRAPAVIDYIVSLARAHKRRLGVRLVKGAYWDTEIRRAQERGWDDFPVFTRKAGTDVSYLACAHRLLEAIDRVDPVFGTHNAMTVAHILEIAADPSRIEFQRLHGMGEDLYRLIEKEGFGCCVYAPVGDREVLLGYLVRRILENGANSSFVHRLFDRATPVGELVTDPVDELKAWGEMRHPLIRRAPDLYLPERRNSQGLDLADPFVTRPLLDEVEKSKPRPASRTAPANAESLDTAYGTARRAFDAWTETPIEARTKYLERLGDLIEKNRAELMGLLIGEAGKTIPDALAEVREAADYCRYYALRARQDFQAYDLPGPTGERNQIRLMGRGVFACISPWNFPLAIFLGQVTAALVAGNSVIAKPAPQTPLIAARAQRLIYESGILADAFQLVQGGADVGAALVQLPVAGVAFTGSTSAARAINMALAARHGPIVPLIAETGGQNALIVDSSALPEQVVDDVITSAFRSAGQRCSALRVLYLPEATADKTITMLAGAMRELHIGDPGRLETDVGPVIDEPAKHKLLDHIMRLKNATDVKEIAAVELDEACANGTFIAPQAWEIPGIGWLEGEIFGPILHVVRYRAGELDDVVASINATGFGLTGGIHSRVEGTARQVGSALRVGNFYINRALTGAVVGVQPFGGEGLSGTGPKAGGPHYLPRFAVEQVISENLTAAGGNASLLISASK